MSKKASVDFLAGFKSLEARDAVRRHPPAPTAVTAPMTIQESPATIQTPQQPSRKGKVAITQWVDPAVRKQIARMALDHDSSQAALVAEALNLLFEKYGQPPIAAPMSDKSSLLEPA